MDPSSSSYLAGEYWKTCTVICLQERQLYLHAIVQFETAVCTASHHHIDVGSVSLAFYTQPNAWRDVATFACISGCCHGHELTSPCTFRSRRTASPPPPQRPRSLLSSHNSNLSEIERNLIQSEVLQLTVHDRTFHAFNCARTSPGIQSHRVRTNRIGRQRVLIC